MKRKRRNHSPTFKTKVALAALRGDKTMPELAVGILIGTTQPGALRITKVHLDAGGQCKALMIRHLTASIPGERLQFYRSYCNSRHR